MSGARREVESNLANIEMGEISVVPKLSDLWCPDSANKTNPAASCGSGVECSQLFSGRAFTSVAVIVAVRNDEAEACRPAAVWRTRGADSFACRRSEPGRECGAAGWSGCGCGGSVGGEFYG
ncbi:hypothetical protein Ahu01nite_002520 [Winogradskya humida]|uniref:Uncharacterized protein n=1 Tax=Winogradskya humida TaxID=113566 RepID=A0ABQ3ZF07_9ACTN|nr:hypothetical protein Ahu01nite_002520 [Actinoplanes humidus]